MSTLEFWKQRQAEFEKYSKQYLSLEGRWQADYCRWSLVCRNPPSDTTILKEAQTIFAAIAKKAVIDLRGTLSIVNREPSWVWLDVMRKEGWGFRVDRRIPCTEREWVAGVRDGKPLAVVRREQKYTTGDEWKKVYRQTKTGRLRRLSRRELEKMSTEDLQKCFHWLENGMIEHIFDASARFCEVLSARSFEHEMATRDPQATKIDFGFWSRTEARFRRLQPSPPRPGEIERESHHGLCAHWNPDGWSDTGRPWYLSNGDYKIKDSFKNVAQSAAIELGHPGGDDSLFFWLDLLRRDGHCFTPFGLGGQIYRVCEASADYCVKRETDVRRATREPTLEENGELQIANQTGAAPPTTKFPNRATWLEDQLRRRKWSVYVLSDCGGPDAKTSRKILACDHVGERVLERLVEALNKKLTTWDGTQLPRLTRRDVPTN